MNRVSMVLACAAMLFAMPAVASDDVASELAEMRELVQGLQEKVDAQEEQLDHQGELLEQAQDVVRERSEQDSESGISAFLDSIEVDGHVAGSYNYNFNTPKDRYDDLDTTNTPFDDDGGLSGGFGSNTGESESFLPFHRDHNTFTIDQIWFGIGKPATEESRGGFRFDMLFGQNANFLGQGAEVDGDGNNSGRRDRNLDGTSDYYIHQAYVEYQCGCFGPEINWKFGKFQTLVGAEVAQAPANFNITRGLLYGFQPVDHLGVLATIPLGDMVEFSAGIVNSVGSHTSSPDFNDEKSYMGSVLVGDDKASLRTSFLYGAEGVPDDPGSSGQLNKYRTGLVDLVATYNPTENVSLWANYDYLYLEGSRLFASSVAVAGRVQVTEKVGVALRSEYVRQKAAKSLPGSDTFIDINDSSESEELVSLTGTVDYALTDHLMMRAEARFDWINDPKDHGEGFFKNSTSDIPFVGRTGEGDNQTVGLVEVIYTY